MKIENNFEIPLPPDEAWKLLLDIERIAPCLPGAEITEVIDDKNYKGKVSLRLGPVALAFAGKATFEEIDNENRTARVKAQGMDSKGRGGANADVVFRVEPSDNGSKVIIETDLNLSGSIAQYGRGVGIIQVVSTQLIGEFTEALKGMLSQSDEGATGETADGAAKPAALAPKPISGFSFMMKVIWSWFTGLFSSKSS